MQAQFPRIIRALQRFALFLDPLATVSVIILVLVVFFNVVARYLFATNWIGLQELEWHLFSLIFLLAMARTFTEDGHVRVDVLYEHFSPRLQHIVNAAGLVLFVLPVCAVIVWSSIDFVTYAFQIGERSPDPGGLANRFVLKAVIPVAVATTGLAAIARALAGFAPPQNNVDDTEAAQ